MKTQQQFVAAAASAVIASAPLAHAFTSSIGGCSSCSVTVSRHSPLHMAPSYDSIDAQALLELENRISSVIQADPSSPLALSLGRHAPSPLSMEEAAAQNGMPWDTTIGRTDEEIQIVFDRHKSALYRLYNRELRKNPTLKGQIVLRMTIEPDGSVSMCELKSTDMKSPELSDQVVTRVRSFDFGVKEGITAVTIVYPIDFLPAT